MESKSRECSSGERIRRAHQLRIHNVWVYAVPRNFAREGFGQEMVRTLA